MKVRWREHEWIFVTILVVTQIIREVLEYYHPAYRQPGTDYATGFALHSIPFSYWKNYLLPQIGTVLLVYLAYLSVNRFIIPLLRKISFEDVESFLTGNIIKAVLMIAVTAYVLALGGNVITFFAKPWLLNYAGYPLLPLLGYNDQPLTNLFFGFGSAAGVVVIFTALTGVRELLIWLIESSGPKREYRVMVINNFTPLLFLYLLVPYFFNPLHSTFMDYLAWTTPALLLYMYETFWLFPLTENGGWRQRRVWSRLYLAILLGSLLFALLTSAGNKLIAIILYKLFLLFIITPLSRLLYQQRRDGILQLRGMQSALERSAADLQLLRSQINPHFLFNALNTLYGTALKEKAEQTATGIQLLGDMMRFMLHENYQDYIPMHKELAYLQNYIALQKLRTPGSPNIRISDNFEAVNCNRSIAPMLLIPFVENAFKHGIRLNKPSWIDIRLICTEKSVQFEVSNSKHAQQENDTEKNSHGIGLKNVTERLKLLYPGKHRLNLQENEKEFTVKLVIE